MAGSRNISITSAIKSTARFWSVLSIGLILLFVFGEGLKLFELTVKEWFAFICFPVGLTAGLAIAWRNEIAGSLIAIICVLIFTLLAGFNWFVYGLLCPALLFLVHGLVERKN